MLNKQPMAASKEVKTITENKDTQMSKAVKKNIPTKKIISVGVFVLFALVTGVAVYSSFELYKVKSPNYQQELVQKQTKSIVNAVGKLIELPSDTPQIATVTDVETLKKNQPFFDNSKNGDQILIFQKEVILYRPSLNKIINVGPIIGSAPQTASQQTAPAQAPSLPSTVTNQPAAVSEP